MFIYDGIKSSFQTIFSHKLRSFLTLLGIIIGITSVITMFTGVYFIKFWMSTGLDSMGMRNLVAVTNINSGSWRWFMQTQKSKQKAVRRIKPLSYDDYVLLKKEVEHKYVYGLIRNVWMKTPKNKWIQIIGTNEDYFKSKSYVIKEGRTFNAFEISNNEKVALVGPKFAKDHFNEADPIGKTFTLGAHRFRIIGILYDQMNSSNGMNFNSWEKEFELRSIFIPLKTAAVYLRNNMSIDLIGMQSIDDESYHEMKTRITQTMLASHNMVRDFEFEDINDFFLKLITELDGFMKKWSLTLIVIASISLLVGGIGLFSTLLISINERMLEIGIRKSVGAREIDIFVYFILESIILSIIAASIGIALGVLLANVLSMILKQPIFIPVMSIWIGFAFALIIGFISGLYPALTASKINPIQAIYYFE